MAKEKQEEEQQEKQQEEEVNDLDLINKAEAAADRLNEQNKRLEANIVRLERAKIESMLGGRSVNVQPGEETPEEYAEKVMKNDIETKDAA